MDKKLANKILIETQQGYDLISRKFSQTRKRFWYGLEFIKQYVHPGDNVLDFGCGNGRLLDLIGDISDVTYYGVDVSEKLITIAKQQHLERNFVQIDPIHESLSFDGEFFNSVYSIAVFHHFPSRSYRAAMARELYRVTKSGGHVIVTVWNLWQKKYRKNILRNWLQKLIGKSETDWNDCMISFTDNEGNRFERFHHAFTKRELKHLFERAGFETILCKTIEGKNIVFVGKK